MDGLDVNDKHYRKRNGKCNEKKSELHEAERMILNTLLLLQ